MVRISLIKPLTHQVAILKDLEKKNKALVHIPSGAGKTHTIAFDVLQKKPKSVLYIVHRNEILLQTVSIFKEVCKLTDSTDIGIINQDNKDYSKRYLFATPQTLSRIKNLEKVPKDIEYIIIDEFHHAAAITYQRIIEYFTPKYLYGLTATPERADLQDIKSIIENNVVGNMDIFTGIEQGVLVSFDYRGYWDNVDYSDIQYLNYRYRQNDLDKKLLIDERDKAIIKKYKELIEPENRPTIGFCNSVKHVKRMTDKFNKTGIKAAGISYMEPFEQRKQILEGFRNNTYKVLFTRDILNEGVDFPECEALLLLRPTMSKVVFLQQLGRGLRTKPGKKNVLVLDFIGNYHNAFKTREYLNEILREPSYTGARYKPEYSHNVPKVYFDEKVVNLFEQQYRRNWTDYGILTKRDIFEDYNSLSAKKGSLLTCAEYKKNKEGRYPYPALIRVYGSWHNFIEENKIPLRTNLRPDQKYPRNWFKCRDKDSLIKNYYKVKEKLGNNKVPEIKDMSNPEISQHSHTAYYHIWGSYTKFLCSIGERKIPILNRMYNDEWVKQSFLKLQKKLKRKYITETEWRRELGGRGKTALQRMGGIKALREMFGGDKNVLYCIQCKTPFESRYVYNGYTKNAPRFCSMKCTHRYRYLTKDKVKKSIALKIRAKEKGICPNCNKSFPKYTHGGRRKNIFCSSECCHRFGYIKRKNRPDSITKKCLNCGKVKTISGTGTYKETSFCSDTCKIERNRKLARILFLKKKEKGRSKYNLRNQGGDKR